MNWIKEQRPPADICPEKYCEFWVPPGGKADMSGRVYRSLREAMGPHDGWVDFPEGGCACTFGSCTRNKAAVGDRDWYEPCEPNLRAAGLPWFYFVPSPEKLAPPFREQFLAESRELWGDDDA